MAKNYLKIAFRYLWRNKLYSSINIAGLTLAMTCALLAILYIRDEISYDRFHKKEAQLYRLTTTLISPQDGSRQTLATTGQVQGPAFKEAIPEFLDYVRIWGINGVNVTSDNKSIGVNTLFADENFFQLFSFPLLRGNAKTVLKEPFSIVLSETVARKFFGSIDIIGKTLKIEEGRGIESLIVTGVAKDAPPNSSLRFGMLLPFHYLQLMFADKNWLNEYLTTFVLLHPDADLKKVEQKFWQVFRANAGEQLREAKSNANQYAFGLQRITDMHLHPLGLNEYNTSFEERGLSGGSSITYSYILSGIVAFILLMACVNFINLSIAGSIKRAKEIGVRKVAGSSRRQIIIQFLTEAAIVCLTAFVLAILLSQLLLPVFNQLAAKKITISWLESSDLFIYGVILMLLCIFLAGIYPAIVASFFNPAKVLYNKQKIGGRNYFGKSLLVLQFTLAIGLVISSLIYYRQMNFISHKDLGYDPSDIVRIHLPPQRVDEKMVLLFRNELSGNTAIQQVAGEFGPPGPVTVIVNGKEMSARSMNADEYYIPLLKIPLKEGRNFSKSFGTDPAHAVIINETFEKEAGWDNAIGRQISMEGDSVPKTVIGVIRDYHYKSMKEKIEPEIIKPGTNEFIVIKIRNNKTPLALAAIEKTYRAIVPDRYYQFAFLDNENAVAYESDKRWQQIITYATVLAIIICCIGLFGLSHFAAQQRTKEIGIRKVLGASVPRIISLLSKEFLYLALTGFVIASPVAWYFMNEWLQDFAYRVDISWWIFVFAGAMVIFIMLVIVFLQTIKAAVANPVEALRSE